MTRMTWLADVLRAEGIQVQETAGWKTRGRDGGIYSMRPRIVIEHHTATRIITSDAAVNKVLIDGRPDLLGPLCHIGLNRAGVAIIIAAGKANHAGAGVWLDANESVEAIGIEAYNYGNSVPFPTREPWPQVQLDAWDRITAALLRKIGRDERSACAHREWAQPSGRKPDPSGIDMNRMRQRIGYLLREDEMTITQARIELATAWHAVSGQWMTAQPNETAQDRLSRLAKDVADKKRTVAEIVTHAPPKPGPSPVDEKVPAWVLDATIPV